MYADWIGSIRGCDVITGSSSACREVIAVGEDRAGLVCESSRSTVNCIMTTMYQKTRGKS